MTEVTVRVHEYFFWSPILGTDAVRFSVFDSRGREYYAVLSLEAGGKTLRTLRNEVAERIFDAMRDQPPGEVTC